MGSPSRSSPAVSRATGRRGQPHRADAPTPLQPIWDLPTRLSHWAIATLFTFQFLTGHFGWLDARIHLWAGYLLLVALIFRLQWGLFGASTARFSHLVAGPRAVMRYLRGMWTPAPGRWPGHNPLGGWSTVLMLGLLLVQGITGLFIETFADLRGPLAERVGRDTAVLMADIHAVLRWPLLAVVLVHVAASLFYLLYKGENRIGAIFISGTVVVSADASALQTASALRAWAALMASIGLVFAIVRFGPVA